MVVSTVAVCRAIGNTPTHTHTHTHTWHGTCSECASMLKLHNPPRLLIHETAPWSLSYQSHRMFAGT